MGQEEMTDPQKTIVQLVQQLRFKYKKDENGNYIFFIPGRTVHRVYEYQPEKNTSLKTTPEETYKDSALKKDCVRQALQTGLFQRISFGLTELAHAKRGILPEGWEACYLLPIRLGGKDNSENLHLFYKTASENLNRYVFVPLIKFLKLVSIEPDKKIFIEMPQTPKVIQTMKQFLDEKSAQEALLAEQECYQSQQKIDAQQQAIIQQSIELKHRRNGVVPTGRTIVAGKLK